MRIAVIGTGGVGGYFGAKLAAAGNDVTFIARGAHLAALRERGLRIESGTSPLHLTDVQATDNPKSVAPVDIVMFCVKLWDVEQAASQIESLVSTGGAAIPFQNGLVAPEVLGRVLGPAHVLGGVAYIAATIREPGVIAHTGTMARLRVGAFTGGPVERATRFADVCRAAGIDVEVSTDVRRALWEKFCFLSALSGCTSVARQPVGAIRSDPDLRATFEAAVLEAWTVGRAQGVLLADDFVAAQLKALDALPAEMRSSMQNDLAGGRRLEAPWLSGAVVALAKDAGIAAPVSGVLYAALKPYVAGAA
ncbi:MAG: 2-dehydropantoate 2-reductase [Casimicrobiaceae bacterium]